MNPCDENNLLGMSGKVSLNTVSCDNLRSSSSVWPFLFGGEILVIHEKDVAFYKEFDPNPGRQGRITPRDGCDVFHFLKENESKAGLMGKIIRRGTPNILRSGVQNPTREIVSHCLWVCSALKIK